MSESYRRGRRSRVSTWFGICAVLSLAVPVPTIAQDRTGAASQWSTAVSSEKKSEARAPGKGEKKRRPAADVTLRSPAAVVAPSQPPAAPPSSAALATTTLPTSEPPVQAAPNGPVSEPASIATAANRLEHESTALEYCRNTGPAVGEARAAFLKQAIAALEIDLARKTRDLEERIGEHKEWIARRQQLMDQASVTLVQMFTRMRPDAAAQQISLMDEFVAAALVMKLEPRASSALLSEMPPARAARLAAIIAAAADISPRQQTAKTEPRN